MGTKKNLETSAGSKHIGHMILPVHRHGYGTEIQKHKKKNLEFRQNLENLHPWVTFIYIMQNILSVLCQQKYATERKPIKKQINQSN